MDENLIEWYILCVEYNWTAGLNFYVVFSLCIERFDLDDHIFRGFQIEYNNFRWRVRRVTCVTVHPQHLIIIKYCCTVATKGLIGKWKLWNNNVEGGRTSIFLSWFGRVCLQDRPKQGRKIDMFLHRLSVAVGLIWTIIYDRLIMLIVKLWKNTYVSLFRFRHP